MNINDRIDRSTEIKRRIFDIIDSMHVLEMRNFLIGLEKWKQAKLNCKREHPRKNTFISALVRINGRSYKGLVTNISASGLFVEVNLPRFVRDGLFIQFDHTVSDYPVKVNCDIVRNAPNGIGVKFDQPLSI
ncbi:MAG: PilZ domain-containing protein [Desulfobacterales bacterium]|nr:MAG: PilZ domain-containing protein [Desulfobacterales bacterium]